MEDYVDILLYYTGNNRHHLKSQIDNQEVVWNLSDDR